MKIYIHVIILLLFLSPLVSNNSIAQITIGGAEKAEAFSILQIEGDKGGLKLPRMTTKQMKDLIPGLTGAEAHESEGLLVYNTDVQGITFWNGSEWVYLFATMPAGSATTSTVVTNAATGVKYTEVELGGDLKASTVIDQKDWDFKIEDENITSRTVNIGGFNIENSDISVDLKGKFSVNKATADKPILDVDMANHSLAFETNTLKVNQDILISTASSTTLNEVKYPNASQAERGKLLVSDEDGNARWSSSRPFGTVVEGELFNVAGENLDFKISDSGDFSSGTRGVNITTKDLVLPKGQWIIFAKCTSQTVTSTNTEKMYHWMDLHKITGTSSDTIYSHLNRTGVQPQVISMDGNATPMMTFPVNIKEESTFRIHMATSNAHAIVYGQDSRFGRSYFFAIMVDGYDPTLPAD